MTGIAQAAPQFTVGDLPSFFQGSLGTNSTLSMFYNSTYFQYQNSTLRLKLEVPYLSVSGLPNGATLSGGSVVSRKGASVISLMSTTSLLGCLLGRNRNSRAIIPVRQI